MNIKENVTVYICEHCKKKMFVKGAMERHEKWCYSNPDNFKACSACMYLEEIEIFYDVNRDSLGHNYGVIHDAYTETKKAKGFHCKKLDKILYPLKVEKKGLPEKYPETFDKQEPMPKECEHSTPF